MQEYVRSFVSSVGSKTRGAFSLKWTQVNGSLHSEKLRVNQLLWNGTLSVQVLETKYFLLTFHRTSSKVVAQLFISEVLQHLRNMYSFYHF